ncbi:hypothetical protein BDV96DRAFT_606014 [Lophiotrema nucula]|uniref:Uncharacterized protein n=1 Tax=Lophiotrema nucula TaxID=690887 RepID=A0A6A5YLQ6_9PLEO|nr:hypothetical protein BDV96DRAFT_606014 [Lophiotrema nucula]
MNVGPSDSSLVALLFCALGDPTVRYDVEYHLGILQDAVLSGRSLSAQESADFAELLSNMPQRMPSKEEAANIKDAMDTLLQSKPGGTPTQAQEHIVALTQSLLEYLRPIIRVLKDGDGPTSRLMKKFLTSTRSLTGEGPLGRDPPISHASEHFPTGNQYTRNGTVATGINPGGSILENASKVGASLAKSCELAANIRAEVRQMQDKCWTRKQEKSHGIESITRQGFGIYNHSKQELVEEIVQLRAELEETKQALNDTLTKERIAHLGADHSIHRAAALNQQPAGKTSNVSNLEAELKAAEASVQEKDNKLNATSEQLNKLQTKFNKLQDSLSTSNNNLKKASEEVKNLRENREQDAKEIFRLREEVLKKVGLILSSGFREDGSPLAGMKYHEELRMQGNDMSGATDFLTGVPWSPSTFPPPTPFRSTFNPDTDFTGGHNHPINSSGARKASQLGGGASAMGRADNLGRKAGLPASPITLVPTHNGPGRQARTKILKK